MNTLAGGSNGSNGDGDGLGSAKKALDAVVSKVEKDSGKNRSSVDMIPEVPADDVGAPDFDEEQLPPPPLSG
jgi:hypothetical protein